MAFPKSILEIMFNDSSGYNYLIYAAPIFILTYIEGPIISTLQAINKANIIMKSSTISLIIKSTVLFISLHFDIKMYSLLIATFIQYFIVIIYQWHNLIKVKLRKY